MYTDIRINNSEFGFDGYFFASSKESYKAFIVIIGDEATDIMNKSCAKWLTKKIGVNALCLGVKQKTNPDGGLHEWPLEYIENAIKYLKFLGIEKMGIIAMSMQASIAMLSTIIFKELSLLIAISPNDYVAWGFEKLKIGTKNVEYPSDTSSISYRNIPFPYQCANQDKDAYWQMYLDSKKKYREMHTIDIFNYSENKVAIPEEAYIRLEEACASIILVAAKDDVMWDSHRYVKRMMTRLKKNNYSSSFKSYIYEYGTHLIVPESMMKAAMPIFSDCISRLYISGKRHPKECRNARIDLDKKLRKDILEW